MQLITVYNMSLYTTGDITDAYNLQLFFDLEDRILGDAVLIGTIPR